MTRSAPMLLLLAATITVPTATALVMPSAAHAKKSRAPKLPKPERQQQKAYLQSQVTAAKATVARGKATLKGAKADAAAAAKREAVTRGPRLASKARYEAALQAFRANETPANKAALDAASRAHLPIRQAHEDAVAAKKVADARLTRLSGLQTQALNRLASAAREAKIGPTPGLRPRVAQWAQIRSQPVNAAVAASPGLIYSQLPPAPVARTNVYSNNGLNQAGQPPYSLPPPPPQFRQYDVVPPLPGNGPPPAVPARRLRQNIYEQPGDPL